MKRLRHWLFSFAAGVSLTLWIAAIALCAFSYYAPCTYISNWSPDGPTTYHSGTTVLAGGVIYVDWVTLTVSWPAAKQLKGLSPTGQPGGWTRLPPKQAQMRQDDFRRHAWGQVAYVQLNLVANSQVRQNNFAVSCWLPVLLLPLIPIWWLIRLRRSQLRAVSGLCAACGYDLRATPDRCPECGAIPQGAKEAAE
jgi:hypothetical protein